MSKVKEKIFVYLGFLIVVILLIIGAKQYADNSQAQIKKVKDEAVKNTKDVKKLSKVQICKVMYQPLKDILVLPGTVEAYEDIDLSAKMGGNVEWLGAEEGDRVKKGDILLKLDISEEKAALDNAQAVYELAETKLKRIKELYQQKIVSVDNLDDAENAVKTAKAQLDAAKIRVENGVLVSPLSGVLDSRDIDLGERIDSGRTVMKIVDIDKVYVVLDIPEKDVLFFKKGTDVSVAFGDGTTHEFTGKIDYISLTAENQTRTYKMKLVVNNPEQKLRPGMIVRANLVRRDIEKAIAVPFFAITDHEKGKSVYIVENGKAVERLIEYGIYQGGLVEIKSGLKEGDSLIMVGQRNIANGEEVEIEKDITVQATEYLKSGKDLSNLAMELSK